MKHQLCSAFLSHSGGYVCVYVCVCVDVEHFRLLYLLKLRSVKHFFWMAFNIVAHLR